MNDSIFNFVSQTPNAGKCALGVMIKAPKAGASKTRLVPPLTHDEAARLSSCFLRDTAQNINAVAAKQPATGVAVYTPIGAEAAFDRLLPKDFLLCPQRGESFGERLFYAAEDLLAAGFDSFCLIDSDSPTLPNASLARAVELLAKPGDRMVLGAAEDGGYYLIGLKKAHRRLFEEIAWSTASVLAETVERAGEINLEVELLPAWYDVDEAESLYRLRDELFNSPPNDDANRPAHYEAAHTRDFLLQFFGVADNNASGENDRIARNLLQSRASYEVSD